MPAGRRRRDGDGAEARGCAPRPSSVGARGRSRERRRRLRRARRAGGWRGVHQRRAPIAAPARRRRPRASTIEGRRRRSRCGRCLGALVVGHAAAQREAAAQRRQPRGAARRVRRAIFDAAGAMETEGGADGAAPSGSFRFHELSPRRGGGGLAVGRGGSAAALAGPLAWIVPPARSATGRGAACVLANFVPFAAIDIRRRLPPVKIWRRLARRRAPATTRTRCSLTRSTRRRRRRTRRWRRRTRARWRRSTGPSGGGSAAEGHGAARAAAVPARQGVREHGRRARVGGGGDAARRRRQARSAPRRRVELPGRVLLGARRVPAGDAHAQGRARAPPRPGDAVQAVAAAAGDGRARGAEGRRAAEGEAPRRGAQDGEGGARPPRAAQLVGPRNSSARAQFRRPAQLVGPRNSSARAIRRALASDAALALALASQAVGLAPASQLCWKHLGFCHFKIYGDLAPEADHLIAAKKAFTQAHRLARAARAKAAAAADADGGGSHAGDARRWRRRRRRRWRRSLRPTTPTSASRTRTRAPRWRSLATRSGCAPPAPPARAIRRRNSSGNAMPAHVGARSSDPSSASSLDSVRARRRD